MARSAVARAELCRLRRDIARIEGRLAEADRLVLDGMANASSGGFAQAGSWNPAADRSTSHGSKTPDRAAGALAPREGGGRVRLGLSALDGILGGGLPLASLHEIRARESRDGGAASGFALALIARLSEAGGAPSIIWISEADCRRETGGLYPPGLLALGLDPSRIVQVAARTEAEALWAFEAALACRGLGAAICELRHASLDLSATRRCALRAREGGVTGLLLRLASPAEPSAAALRFRLAPAPAGRIGRFAAGIGRMAWTLALEKNRGGRTGVFTVEWNAYERCFAEPGAERRAQRRVEFSLSGQKGQQRANPQPLPPAPPDRPPHPAQPGRAGGLPGFRRAS